MRFFVGKYGAQPASTLEGDPEVPVIVPFMERTSTFLGSLGLLALSIYGGVKFAGKKRSKR